MDINGGETMSNLKKYLEEIKEEFVTGYEGRFDYIEIFKNPSLDELMSFEDYVRFIALQEERDLYISSVDILHYNILLEAGVKGDINNILVSNFPGVGKIEGKRVLVENISEMIEYDYPKRYDNLIKEIERGDYDWLEDYRFNLSELKGIVKVI